MTTETLPRTFGPYELVRHLGTGGMGTTYEATQNAHGITRRVVVKVLKHMQITSIEQARFEREAKMCLAFDHPAIVRAYAYGHAEGRAYMAMELVSGVTAAQLLRSIPETERLSSELVAYITTELASALAYAHGRGVLHRDVCASNVMLSDAGEVKLLDFGVARPANSTLTRTGLFVGKWGYAAPETLREGRSLPASDIYQLGVVAAELALRRSLFRCTPMDALTMREIADVRQLLEGTRLTPPVIDIITRCLEMDAEVRFENGEKLHDALCDVLPAGIHWMKLAPLVERALASATQTRDPNITTTHEIDITVGETTLL